ncbi:Double-strand break repair protein MRE11 [Dissostichus eleginoides]|uniref:Double-strand break repair protein MRE11 n=1 Tax=Dissostichus eleginoides TaxID=100907 RepID=A0AAD9CJB2_DISEL|nr:Double-strand break repair protein MRE11 [Dissostichus eleginoides]
MGTRTILRVIVHDGDTRKITLNEKPQTLESLVEQLEGKLGLQYKFCLQYEDPDFNDALVNLADSADLPEQPTIKILLLVPTPTPSTADTDTMSISSPESRSTLTRSPWPDNFEIPYFPVDIKYRLRHGNLLYMRDKKYLQVPRDMKHEILEKLAETIYSFKAYPVMKNTLMLQLLLFKNIHVSLNQAPPMDVMAGKIASNLQWVIIAQNYAELGVMMWP